MLLHILVQQKQVNKSIQAHNEGVEGTRVLCTHNYRTFFVSADLFLFSTIISLRTNCWETMSRFQGLLSLCLLINGAFEATFAH